MTGDPAAFRQDDIQAVWHGDRRCALSLRPQRDGQSEWYNVDDHHILGRGEEFGIKKSDPRRAWFSSVYNRSPLWRSNHEGPHVNHPLMRRLLLDITRKKVHWAIGQGEYESRAEDAAFLTEVYFPWLDKNRSWVNP